MNAIAEIMDKWNLLCIEDKEYTIDILNKNLIDEKREKIELRIAEAVDNYNKGLCQTGTVDDLFDGLAND